MNPEIKAKWIEALCSGKYPQERGVFCTPKSRGKCGYCVVGLLLHVATGKNGMEVIGVSGTEMEELVGGNENLAALFSMNDAGVPFEMMAGLVHEAL